VALIPGTRLGVYEIAAQLGAGGMGEVYRATDTKLKRPVAVKILPMALAADPDRLARFQREAEVLATLNHLHIAAIYGLEEADGVKALVMELVDGDDLSQRIARGPIPLDEALPIARQIAEALEAAHELGIIHRDLKPANIKVRPDGTVKVLDFGLAKLTERAAAARAEQDDRSRSPTLTTPAMTGIGMILGTAAYMSPEQARGRAVDKRTDVWAFGAVLYEMLTGARAFNGEDTTEMIAAVIKTTPDWSALPADLPRQIATLIQRCLEKDYRKRIGDISTARFLIDESSIAAPSDGVPTARVAAAPFWTRAIPVVTTAIVTAAMVGGFAWRARPSLPPKPVARFQLALADGQRFTNTGRPVVAISPDGMQIAYVTDQGLYVRSMADVTPMLVAATAGVQGVLNPVFSPDGRSLAFWSAADGAIKRIAISGGVAVTLSPVIRPFGMTWDVDDGLLVGQPTGIVRVPAAGGRMETVVKVNRGEIAHRPQMLPDNRTVLFTVATGVGVDRWDNAKIVVQSLESSERKTVVEGGSDGRYLPTGHIVYAIGGALFAVPFDVRRLAVTGSAVPIVEGVLRATTPEIQTGVAHFAVSNSGSLVYVPGPVATRAQVSGELTRLTPSGGLETLKLLPGPYGFPRISPDGKRVAFGTDDGKDAIVWIYDQSGTSTPRRLTFGGKNRFPIWSADSQWVAFQSDRDGDFGIFRQCADGSGTAERLTTAEPGTAHFPESWSPTGERFLFSASKESNVSLWTFSLPDKRAELFGGVQQSTASLSRAVFSRDGRWVAYGADEPGAIYVQPFPATGAKYQISKDAAHSPVWSPDGKQIYYVTTATRPAGQLVVVNVTTQPGFSVSNPVPVPTGRLQLSGGLRVLRRFDMGPDGAIIGVVDSVQTAIAGALATARIEVVLNWFEELKARVPASK
jgi:eukaryotic-like serine/threonine-protein kinase